MSRRLLLASIVLLAGLESALAQGTYWPPDTQPRVDSGDRYRSAYDYPPNNGFDRPYYGYDSGAVAGRWPGPSVDYRQPLRTGGVPDWDPSDQAAIRGTSAVDYPRMASQGGPTFPAAAPSTLEPEPAGPGFSPPAFQPEPFASPTPPVLVAPKPAVTPKIWEGEFELGLTGTEGNSQTFNVRFGSELKRKTDTNVLSADLDYHRDSTDTIETAHEAFLDWRWEWLLGDSPWTWFVHGTVEYDEFKAFDLRVAADTGIGYHFVKNETTTLLGRVGGGFSREIGGPDDSYVPELLFGLEYERQLSERQKLTASIEYAPDVTAFDDYRLNTEVGWKVLLDEAWNLSLKASALNRFDSTPHGRKPNDVDYALTVLWGF